jgi:NhaC family Na+:H+ antiporter
VLRIFLLIGLLTALWRASGTITFFVYHGVRLIPPSFFLVAGFGLTSLLGYALGTSYGTTGTVGVILITLARAGGVPPALMAGAVLSGAYFGDRTGPASSCANLVATVTGTDLYGNLRAMLKSSVVPMAACFALYGVLSPRYPLAAGEGGLITLMEQNFSMSLWCTLPALLMLVLPLCKVPVRTAMTASIAAAAGVGLWVQDQSLVQLLSASLFGYIPSDPQLAEILSGGGLLSMLTVSKMQRLRRCKSATWFISRIITANQAMIVSRAVKLRVLPSMQASFVTDTSMLMQRVPNPKSVLNVVQSVTQRSDMLGLMQPALHPRPANVVR